MLLASALSGKGPWLPSGLLLFLDRRRGDIDGGEGFLSSLISPFVICACLCLGSLPL